MARKNRRDCRVGDRKKNALNKRVEDMQQAIRKKSKKGAAAPAPAEQPKLTPTAAEFLSQMRAEVAVGVQETRAKLQPASSAEPS